jgi:hypothetical protein
MKRTGFVLSVALFGLIVMAGCATPARVMNVTDRQVSADKKPTTADDVRGAIRRAGAALGWRMKDEGPGRMTGTLLLRQHVATVGIDYDATKYSIQYQDSTNLRYDAAKGTIHRNYNSWIQNLDKGIQRELFALH